MSDFYTRLLRVILNLMIIVDFILAGLITMYCSKLTDNPIKLLLVFFGSLCVLLCMNALIGAFTELCYNVLQIRINTSKIDSKTDALLKVAVNGIAKNMPTKTSSYTPPMTPPNQYVTSNTNNTSYQNTMQGGTNVVFPRQ